MSNVEIDALFALPLDEFTAARNGLVTKLKKAGHEADAEQVRRMAKPSLSAWAVNQVYWHHRDAFDRLLVAGQQFRRAQAAQLAGESTNIREPLAAHREALGELSRHAAVTLREAGHLPTPDMMRRVTLTLEALAALGAQSEGPRAGRLTTDVDPPGFETLAALVPRAAKIVRAGSPSNRLLTFQRAKQPAPSSRVDADERRRRQDEERQANRVAAKAAVQEAGRAVREAQKAAERANAGLKKAAARAKDAEKQKSEAEQVLEKAAAASDAARQEARRVAADAEAAAQAVEDAERALAKATHALEALD